MLLLALTVSPVTAPFSPSDLSSVLYPQAPHEGASLKLKAPDHHPAAGASRVVLTPPCKGEGQPAFRPILAFTPLRLPVDPPLRV